jgi:tetratricopeptide (TPR) repeat protein
MGRRLSPMVIKEEFFFTEASEGAQRVKDRLVILSEELNLAKKWNRPSLLIAIYRSEYVREYAETEFEKLVLANNEKVLRFKVAKDRFDIPAELKNSSHRRERIFFISGLKRGGGKSGRNAYRALNLRREYLVDEKIRAVFWLTAAEAHGLPRFAPDFWAFRHRVIELDDFYFQSYRSLSKAVNNLIWHDNVAQHADVNKFEPVIRNAEILAERIRETDFESLNIKQLYLFAYMLWKTGSNHEALILLERGIQFATQAKDTLLQSKLLSGMGIVNFQIQNFNGSSAALNKACSLNPDDHILWNNLSLPLYYAGQVDDAIFAIEKAIAIRPRHAGSWRTLGSIYFDLGYLDDARLAYQRCVKYDSQDPLAWQSLGTVFNELADRKQALHAFRKANKIDSTFEVPAC